MKKLILVIFFAGLMVSCSDSKTVNLRDSQNSNVDERGNPTPTPSPSPTVSPSPSPTPGTPGDDNGDGDDNGGGDDRNTPTPTPTPVLPSEKVARIYCESESTPVRSFLTLRSDVWTDYMMPTITPYIEDRYVVAVKSPVPLQSDGEQSFIIVRALEDDTLANWKIYKSNVNLPSARADLQPISNFGSPSQATGYAYKNLKLEPTLVTANFKRTAYVYPNDSGAYVWENMKGTKMVLPFSANSSFSPFFTGADDYLRFDQNNGARTGLIQKLYNFNTKKTLSLPTPADSKDSQLFAYINDARTTVYWVEGRPETSWKIRSMGLGTSQRSATLLTLTGKNSNIALPMVFAELNGVVTLAYSEEELGQDKNRLPYLKEANLHLVKISQGKATDEVVAYSDELKNLTKNALDLNRGILRGLFFEPISGKFFASGLPVGGLASFDPKNNSWATHAMISSVFSCLNPQWGIEVPRD